MLELERVDFWNNNGQTEYIIIHLINIDELKFRLFKFKGSVKGLIKKILEIASDRGKKKFDSERFIVVKREVYKTKVLKYVLKRKDLADLIKNLEYRVLTFLDIARELKKIFDIDSGLWIVRVANFTSEIHILVSDFKHVLAVDVEFLYEKDISVFRGKFIYVIDFNKPLMIPSELEQMEDFEKFLRAVEKFVESEKKR